MTSIERFIEGRLAESKAEIARLTAENAQIREDASMSVRNAVLDAAEELGRLKTENDQLRRERDAARDALRLGNEEMASEIQAKARLKP